MRLLVSSCLPLCPSAWKKSASDGKICMKFDDLFFHNSVEKI